MRGRGYLKAFVGLLCVVGGVSQANASLTVLVGEPFGKFGTMMPVGHTSLYLDRVCADGPVKLRMCRADEPQGVTIARLDAIGELDWIASPILDFLYGTERAEEIPAFATEERVEELRQAYRRRVLLQYFPDGTETRKKNNEWWETVGVSYSRKVWGYELATSREQDEAFVARMNAMPNRHAYRLHAMNCADFVADAVNFYYPGTVRSDRVADYALMTPKQVARAVEAYGDAHPELEPRVTVYPQIAGTMRRSRPVRGGTEMILKTKRYVTVLTVIQPEITVALTALYLKHGRWVMGRGAEPQMPETVMSEVLRERGATGMEAEGGGQGGDAGGVSQR